MSIFRFKVREETEIQESWGRLPKTYIEYVEYCNKTRGLSPYTMRIRRRFVLQFMMSNPCCCRPSSMGKLSVKNVHDYIIKTARPLSLYTKASLSSSLRDFLRFAFIKGYHDKDLSKYVPTIVMPRLARYPKGMPWDIVQKLLRVPDRHTLQGKRDYAILLLLSKYGIRPRQITELKLKDIDWYNRTIFIKAMKGGKDVVLPLEEDVAAALLDYLKAGRMDCPENFEEVFLTLSHGKRYQRPFLFGFYFMFSKYLRKIGFRGGPQWRGGPYAIRHAVASKLLREKTPIKTIADLYGHRSIDTTFIYAKVDFKALAKLVFDWPQEVQR